MEKVNGKKWKIERFSEMSESQRGYLQAMARDLGIAVAEDGTLGPEVPEREDYRALTTLSERPDLYKLLPDFVGAHCSGFPTITIVQEG